MSQNNQNVYIVDGARTPFLKVHGEPGPFTPVDLAVQCGRPLLLRQPFSPGAIDQVILGCVNVIPEEMNPARVAALRMGMGNAMNAFTVQINCGSGMQSIDTAYHNVRSGEYELIMAGGTEALSHAPMVFKPEAVKWLSDMRHASSPQDYVKKLADFSVRDFIPSVSLEAGLTDPVVNLGMGQTAEVVAQLFNVTRKESDEYALRSHQRLAQAQESGWLDEEVEFAFGVDGSLYRSDDGLRKDSTLEDLSRLSPAFEKPFGQVTAGNSSQVTDGASWVILASEKAVDRYGLEPRAVIRGSHWAALDPEIMGLAPVLAMYGLLKKHSLDSSDVDLWEINEAFAAQVLGVLRAWSDIDFIRTALKQNEPFSPIDDAHLNIDGGAIAMGHPVGASGNRIVLHLINALRRNEKQRGIASECIGGGQAGAMLLEAV